MAPALAFSATPPVLATSPETLARLGAAIGARLQVGDAVCLSGPLGAGKTTLARGLIRALCGPDEDVPSPTFTLAQIYETPRLTVTHFDLYRLAAPEEAFELGLDEALETGAAVIEWPQRLDGALPQDRLDVDLSFPPLQEGAAGHAVEGRLVRLTAHGSWSSRADQLEDHVRP